MAEEKKCTYCAMMIPKEAKICPHCRKKMPISGGVAFAVILIFTFIIILAIGSGSNTSQRTPPANSDPATATDDQIYREFEICMNNAKKILPEDKLRGQRLVASCTTGMQKYGDARARKAFQQYYDFGGFE